VSLILILFVPSVGVPRAAFVPSRVSARLATPLPGYPAVPHLRVPGGLGSGVGRPSHNHFLLSEDQHEQHRQDGA
jgi:hypothetical protein